MLAIDEKEAGDVLRARGYRPTEIRDVLAAIHILEGASSFRILREGDVPLWMERLEHATEVFTASDGDPAIRLVAGPVYRLKGG